MSGQRFSFDDFHSLLRMEVGRGRRVKEVPYRFSLLYFQLHETPEMVQDVAKEMLRQSDAVFHRKEHFFLILPETDKEGALHIPRLLEEYFKRPVFDSAVTFPEDGDTEEDLVATLADQARSVHGVALETVLR